MDSKYDNLSDNDYKDSLPSSNYTVSKKAETKPKVVTLSENELTAKQKELLKKAMQYIDEQGDIKEEMKKNLIHPISGLNHREIYIEKPAEAKPNTFFGQMYGFFGMLLFRFRQILINTLLRSYSKKIL